VVESSGLLNRRRGLNLYRGFESPPLRQLIFHIPQPVRKIRKWRSFLAFIATVHNTSTIRDIAGELFLQWISRIFERQIWN
jgi:hypothetical protein